MSNSPFQPSLSNLLGLGIEKRKKHMWKVDQKTLEQRGIRIPNVTRLFFTPTKQSYSKHVEIIKMWKNMGDSEQTWASKARLVTLLDIEWNELNHDNLVEFLNTFMIKANEICFGRKGVVYVIGKQIIAYAFGLCQSGYAKDPKGHVTKMLVEELLFNHDIKPPYINTNKYNIKKCKIPINIRYLADTYVVYQWEKVNYMNNENALTFMKVEEG
jgi:hypothetical protein